MTNVIVRRILAGVFAFLMLAASFWPYMLIYSGAVFWIFRGKLGRSHM
jgi:hypothetical protein